MMDRAFFFFVVPQDKCFWGYTEISLSVCLSVCVQNLGNLSLQNPCSYAASVLKLCIHILSFFEGEQDTVFNNPLPWDDGYLLDLFFFVKLSVSVMHWNGY